METFEKIMKNITTNQSDFFQYFDSHDEEFKLVLDYFDEEQYGFGVYLHLPTKTYIYVEQDENDATVYEVELIATLNYNTQNDLLADINEMSTLFDSVICGETFIDDDGNVEYLWFQ